MEKEKKAFVMHTGFFNSTVMPFGLCNAPATIQRLTQEVFVGPGRLTHFVRSLLAISRYYQIMEQHIVHLRLILEKQHSFNIKLHPGKCQLALLRVTLWITPNIVTMLPPK